MVMLEIDQDWQPTELAIEALPEPLKNYILELQNASKAFEAASAVFGMEERAAELLRALQKLRDFRSTRLVRNYRTEFYDTKLCNPNSYSNLGPELCRSKFKYIISRMLRESEIWGTNDFEEAKRIARQFRAYVVIHYPPPQERKKA